MPSSQLKHWVAAFLLLLALGACVRGAVKSEASPTQEPPVVPAFATVEPRGSFPDAAVTTAAVHYEAGLRFTKSNPEAVVGRMRLQPYVRIFNNGRQSAEIRLNGCPVSLRMYPDPDHLGPAMWDDAAFRERAGGCTQDDYVVVIEPGQVYDADDEVDITSIFDDSVPVGHYRFSVVLAEQDRPPQQLGVWHAFISRGAGGLVFTTETSMVDVAPRRLEVVVTTTNISDRRVRLEYGSCAVWLKAHSQPERAGTPIWDELKRPNPDPKTGIHRVCVDDLAVTELEPGESMRPEELHKLLPEPEILGDLLQDGRYYFTASVELDRAKFDLRAGQEDLTRVQDPLPPVRTVGGLRYEAEPLVYSDSSNSINSGVTITNVTDVPLEAVYPVHCPVVLYAYRDKAMRDIAFRGDEPDWRPPDRCVLDMERQVLPPGGAVRVESSVAVSEFRKTVDAGQYYFVAVIHVIRQRGWSVIVLSAGEADIPE